MTYYDVIIATPGSSVDSGYLTSLMDTAQVLSEKNISFKFVNGASSIVSEARNCTVYDSDLGGEEIFNGKDTYGKIFWIDSDMGWTPENFLKLYEADYDIVSGVYVRSDWTPCFGTAAKNAENIYMQLDKPFEVLWAGFGFICMKSGVMESVKYPWFQLEYGYNENGESYHIGEDVFFLRQAKRNGHTTYIDPSVSVSHHKIKSLIYKLPDPIEDKVEIYEDANDNFLKEFLF